MDDQVARSDFVGWLNEQGYESRGYLAPIFDVEGKKIELLWKDVSSSLRSEVTAEASKRGIAVEFRPSKRSASELKQQQQAVIQDRESLIEEGFTIDGVGGVTTASDAAAGKLRVYGRSTPPKNAEGKDRENADRISRDEVKERLERRVGMAVEVLDSEMVPLAATRPNDTPLSG